MASTRKRSDEPSTPAPEIHLRSSRTQPASNGARAESGDTAGAAPAGNGPAGGAQSRYRPNYTRPTRRPADERENAFDMLAWMLEGATGIVDELRHNDLGLSEEFWVHAAAARRETLLAMHAALESIIEKTNAAEKEQQEREVRRERRGGIAIE
jgi:sarcosine oxidase delta subunit